jgi:hypothetical protein
MAINSTVNVTVNPAAAKQPDGADHRHTVTQSAAAGGDLSIGIDSSKVTTQSILSTAIAAAHRSLAGQLPP